MTEVIPGVFQLPLPLPNHVSPGHINVYLIRGRDGCLLVDTGWNTDEDFSRLKQGLAQAGAGFGDIKKIVITHIHPDHYGLTGRLKELSGARLALHRREKDLIESRYINMSGLLKELEDFLHKNGVVIEELPELQQASAKMVKFVTPAPSDVTLKGGETIELAPFSFKVIWTPGHSPGHICLYEPNQKLLISGDHILPTITPNVGIHPQSSPSPLGDYLKSLDKVARLEVSLVLPGHGDVFSDLHTRIEELTQHHEQRNSEILKILKARPRTAYQVATELTWGGPANHTRYQDFNPWHKRLAVLETLAHLELLLGRGAISKFQDRDATCYKSNSS